MPSRHKSSACTDYVPAICTHRPSLLLIGCRVEIGGLRPIGVTLSVGGNGRFRNNFRSTVEARGSKHRFQKRHPRDFPYLSNEVRAGRRRYNFVWDLAAHFPEIPARGTCPICFALLLLMLCFRVLGPSRSRPGEPLGDLCGRGSDLNRHVPARNARISPTKQAPADGDITSCGT